MKHLRDEMPVSGVIVRWLLSPVAWIVCEFKKQRRPEMFEDNAIPCERYLTEEECRKDDAEYIAKRNLSGGS